jgi:eukaryotic-like serine/threonine-protein kinase
MKATVTREKRRDRGILSSGATRKVAASGVDGMASRSESARNVIRVNGTSIDVTSSNTITFGYVNELARAGRVIAGRHRLQCPLPAPANKKAGPCSSLWRADSFGLGKPVQVELLDPVIAEDPVLADLFFSEASSAAAVASPFVSRVLDFGVEVSTPYLVTEVAAGVSLADRIATDERPTGHELARIMAELAQAVDEMHGAGLLHRDLRSERVLLWNAAAPLKAERQVAKLAFGISKLMNDTLELVRTMAHRAVGPADLPLYASPEQVLGTAPLSAQSDLWSLAVIAFECVTGELPFVGATIGERLVQICTGAARVPSEVCAVPHGFDAWFARGVRKAASERWPTAGEMATSLARIL